MSRYYQDCDKRTWAIKGVSDEMKRQSVDGDGSAIRVEVRPNRSGLVVDDGVSKTMKPT